MPNSTEPRIITRSDEQPAAHVRRGLAPVSPTGTIEARDVETTASIAVIHDDRRMPARRTADALPRVVDDPTRPLHLTQRQTDERTWHDSHGEAAQWERLQARIADTWAKATHSAERAIEHDIAAANADEQKLTSAIRSHQARLTAVDARLAVVRALISGDENALSAATAHAVRIRALNPRAGSHVLQVHAETGEFPAVAA